MSDLNEYILEVRYKPMPQVIDNRGLYVESISKYMELTEWDITDNRIDVFDRQKSVRAFIGFKNAGLVVLDISSDKYFSNRATRLIKCLFSFESFRKNLFIYRIGVRLKICKEYKGSFEKLKEEYINKYFSFNNKVSEIYGSKPNYVFAEINFTSDSSNFNTRIGPMTDNDMQKYFKRKGIFPKVGIYFDIDNWVKDVGRVDEEEINNKILNFTKFNLEKIHAITALILERKK